jgi:tagatose-1,6-bisphosphate aldolase
MNPKLFTQNNSFFMLALDHRGSFEKLAGTTDEKTLINLKLEIINSLIYQFSGVLIDRTYGFKAYSLINKDILKPFLLPIEKSGYKESGDGRLNELDTSAGEIRDLGGSGVKLLIYFNKKDKNSKKQIELAKVVNEQCKQENIPFFLAKEKNFVHPTPRKPSKSSNRNKYIEFQSTPTLTLFISV